MVSCLKHIIQCQEVYIAQIWSKNTNIDYKYIVINQVVEEETRRVHSQQIGVTCIFIAQLSISNEQAILDVLLKELD